MKRIFIILSTILLFLCVILFYNKNNTYQTVEKLTKKGNTIAFMLEQDDGSYQNAEELPTGYEFNQERSQCNNGAKPTWDSKTNSLRLSLTKKNTSCFLYFDKSKSTKKLDELELTLSKEGCPVVDENGSASVAGIEDSQKLICSSIDDAGETFYFRGAVDNNWVKFAGLYWRIIRINGNGSIRLIYAGDENTNVDTIGNGKNAIDNKSYNEVNNDNTFVGFTNMATGLNSPLSTATTDYNQAHSGSNPSNILNELNNWYVANLVERTDKIDTNSGFCNDRQINTVAKEWWTIDTAKGFGNNETAYGAYHRSQLNSWNTVFKPTFKCKNTSRDLYTITDSKSGNNKLTNPIGLITVDEAVLAGGLGGQVNDSYWLYTNQLYWTMSPNYFYSSSAYMFFVNSNGRLDYWPVNQTTPGVRPVINLKADAKLITNKEDKKGTIDNPYIVEGAE